MAIFYFVESDVMTTILMVCTFALFAFEAIRFSCARLNKYLVKRFAYLIKRREKRNITAATFYVAGLLLAVGLFPKNIAMMAMAFMAVGDPIASVVGRLWGERKGKSIIGSVAFFVSSFVAGLILLEVGITVPLFTLFAGAIGATLAEFFCPLGDDNLSIPVIAGFVMKLL